MVPEGGALLMHNLTQIVDGHTGVEHTLPVATAYDDVLQLWSDTQVGYTATLGVAYGGLGGENYWYAHTDVWADERLLSFVMLGVIDEKWKDHLHDLDQLRNAIQYRSWGQKDPLLEYKQEAFTMFEDLLHDVHHTFTERFLRAQLVFEEPAPPPARRGPPPPPAGTKYNEFGMLVPADDPGGAAGPPPKGDGRKKKGR